VGRPGADAAQKNLSQDNRIVAGFIVRRKDKR
jgi:hypothetical protein